MTTSPKPGTLFELNPPIGKKYILLYLETREYYFSACRFEHIFLDLDGKEQSLCSASSEIEEIPRLKRISF